MAVEFSLTDSDSRDYSEAIPISLPAASYTPVSDTVTIDSTRHRWAKLEVSARLVATDSVSIKRLSMIFKISFPRWQTAKFINTEYL